MSPKDELRKYLKWAVIGVVLSWIIIPLIVIYFYGQPESPGTFGDTFGIINALFSSLAFALLIYTSMMQRQELELQRMELELTRKELEKSAQAQQTLVRLTEEQVELEKLVRRDQIKPELVLKDHRWAPQTDKMMLQINFLTKYNKLKFFRTDLRGNFHGFSLNHDWDRQMLEKYHDPNTAVFVIIERTEMSQAHPTELHIDIYFQDADSRNYRQTLIFDQTNMFLSSPTVIHVSEFLMY